MTSWTSDELGSIDAADELEVAPLRSDGSLRRPTTIWVVRVGDDLYVRCVNGRDGAWFRSIQARYEGHVSAGGVARDVTFEDAGDDTLDEIDEAYRTKYDRYGPHIVGSTLTPRRDPAPSSSYRGRSAIRS